MTKPDWTSWRNILVFGGSFDPPHRAHLTLPRQVREHLSADGVVYVPAGRAPHKLDKKQTDPEHRLAMLRLALKDTDRTAISPVEVERVNNGRPSYTIDTLETFASMIQPDATMRLLVGTDQIPIFEKWYRWQDVERLAEPIVMVRPPETTASVLANIADAERRAVWANRLVEVDRMDESSTAIREAIQRAEDLSNRLGPDVAAYIAEHGLYRK